jgi:hypothetical protein
MATKQPIILTDEIVPPPALIRAGLDALPSIIRAQGERASRRFIEFFTANIRNRNTRMAYARDVMCIKADRAGRVDHATQPQAKRSANSPLRMKFEVGTSAVRFKARKGRGGTGDRSFH